MEIIKNILASPNFWAIIAPFLLAVWTFFKAKEAEREAEWRREKLKFYLNFVEALSGITDSEITDAGEIHFAKACNDLHALAPSDVLKALWQYQEEIRITNPAPSGEKKQLALDRLLLEMRKDMKLKPSDKKHVFHMRLWTSGKTKKAM